MHTKPIVVGVDGSASALHAVRWAAVEAVRAELPLRLVHTYEIPLGYPQGRVDPHAVLDAFRAQGEQFLRDAAGEVAAVAPDLRPEAALERAPTVEGLVEQSSAAALLVLGTRRHAGFSGLRFGTVTVDLASNAHCPVVAVRGPDGSEAPPEDGPVVVGVDGTPASEGAIAFAFEHAATHGRELVAVHTWTEALVETALVGTSPAPDFRPLKQQAYEALAERLAGWQEKFPQVKVTREVVQDRPARALLRYAAKAALVVVGTRARGGFRSMILGSTSQHLLYHAPCPVAVVRADTEEYR